MKGAKKKITTKCFALRSQEEVAKILRISRTAVSAGEQSAFRKIAQALARGVR